MKPNLGSLETEAKNFVHKHSFYAGMAVAFVVGVLVGVLF